ncbi:Alpha/Beta hydrolase protein [Podospora aff. communis PSN243]|uniref:Carboxylic ester hydrolase n=1 Tax=Podospora aff. communis PSN243 TaxID=3040156 RepID=A0AAV9H1B7_9PEZI|nr:Alpha/Beta hydrolase protein [Podospora aff. communis PSN243]
MKPLRVTLAVLIPLAASVKPLVDVNNQYIGQPLPNGITQWLGIRYAAPPVGELRFAPPGDPTYDPEPKQANKHGKICLKTGERANTTETSEDCLFLDVYAPTWAARESQLPVFVFIQGGGFNANANPNLNGSGLLEASNNSIVFVTFNYRAGPYGFLTDGQHVTANNGLRDQRKALHWVQRHIAEFGGNPAHVVIGGASAGAASIALHLTAYGGRDDGLIHAAAAGSVSFGMMLTARESAYQYRNLLVRLDCAGHDPLACLRSKSVAELQKKNVNDPYPGATNAPLFMWGPVIDGDLITKLPYEAFRDGQFLKVPVIFGDDTNGGTVFTPVMTSTRSESNRWLINQFPNLGIEQLLRLNELYPNSNETMCPEKGCWWRQLSDVYGEMRYMCPGLFLNSALARYGVEASYAYRWNVEDPEEMSVGIGVPHTVEVSALFGPENVEGKSPASYYSNGTNAGAVQAIQGYWTRFIKTFNPNDQESDILTQWETWSKRPWSRLLFDTGGATSMETSLEGLRERCEYLASIGIALHQ